MRFCSVRCRVPIQGRQPRPRGRSYRIVDYEGRPEEKEYDKRNNHNNEGQEKLQVCDLIWENRFNDIPNNPDRCARYKQRHQADGD